MSETLKFGFFSSRSPSEPTEQQQKLGVHRAGSGESQKAQGKSRLCCVTSAGPRPSGCQFLHL